MTSRNENTAEEGRTAGDSRQTTDHHVQGGCPDIKFSVEND